MTKSAQTAPHVGVPAPLEGVPTTRRAIDYYMWIPYRQNIPALRLTGELCRTRNQISASERERIPGRELSISEGAHREKREDLLRGKREKSSKSGSFGGTYVYAHYRQCPGLIAGDAQNQNDTYQWYHMPSCHFKRSIYLGLEGPVLELMGGAHILEKP